VFEGEYLAKATRSVACEELDSPWQQRTITEHSLFISFWPIMTCYCFCTHPTRQIYLLPTSSFLKDEDAAERSPFSHCCQDPVRIAKGYGLAYTKWLRGCIPAVARTLRLVHCWARWLFQRRWYSNLGK
jgi:hypothetical protein